MKRRYIEPLIFIEEIEIDGVMNAHPSQWSINVDNEATDNPEEHGQGIGGSDNTDPEDPPICGD